MTVQSYSGVIDTNGAFVSVESATGITFTSGHTYTMSVTNRAFIKVANAIFPVADEKFIYIAGESAISIKTEQGPVELTILEGE